MKYKLVIIKSEVTLNGINLSRDERRWISLGGYAEAVRHTTILLEKPFSTIKAAWAYITPELTDSLGLVWDNTYNTEYADYSINVVRT